MNRLFIKYNFDAVIHFAALKSIDESIRKPLLYYKNNILGIIVLSELSVKYRLKKFIFSSSATVYGNNKSPLKETMELKQTENPYGESKAMSERILKDVYRSNPTMSIAILRYFNPVGAHDSGLIGDNPKSSISNLMPIISNVARGVQDKLLIYGGDYNTIDGTGVRDYVHVVDLAKGHIAALKKSTEGFDIYNLGTGKGYSVLQLIDAFEKVNNVRIPYLITSRRQGDLASVFSDVSKAKEKLEWEAKFNLTDMVRDSWNFYKNLE
jgi:UDP-glucose 4-epimerase